MSYVTGITFITDHSDDIHRFEYLIATLYTRYGLGYEVHPVESGGSKYPTQDVFHLGLNYADGDLVEALRAEPWNGLTVLYLTHDGFGGADIYVCGVRVHQHDRS